MLDNDPSETLVALECACHDPNHMIVVEPDAELRTLYISVQLNPYLPWHKRAWLGLMYIFGVRTVHDGHWESALLEGRTLEQFRAALDKLRA